MDLVCRQNFRIELTDRKITYSASSDNDAECCVTVRKWLGSTFQREMVIKIILPKISLNTQGSYSIYTKNGVTSTNLWTKFTRYDNIILHQVPQNRKAGGCTRAWPKIGESFTYEGSDIGRPERQTTVLPAFPAMGKQMPAAPRTDSHLHRCCLRSEQLRLRRAVSQAPGSLYQKELGQTYELLSLRNPFFREWVGIRLEADIPTGFSTKHDTHAMIKRLHATQPS